MGKEHTPSERAWTVALRAPDAETLEIDIYDMIGESFFGDGITGKDVLEKLRGAPSAKTISLRINSSGGVTDEAKAMVNLLAYRAGQGAKIEAHVDGMAASSASYLTTVATRVVMPSNAFLMLHEVRGGAFGRAKDMEQRAEFIRKENAIFADAYARASARRGKKKSKEDYLAAMAFGDLYLTADEAIEWGLADEKTEPIKAVAVAESGFANIGALENAPESLRTAPYVVLGQSEIPAPKPVEPPTPEPAPAPPGPAPRTPAPAASPPEAPQPPPIPAPAAVSPPAASTALPGQTESRPMTEPVTPPVAAAPEPASVTVSGVKLLGVSTEAEAHARINDLNKLSIALLGVTGKASHAEALLAVNAWKTGHDQSIVLGAKVTELDGQIKSARRDGMIEKLSREGRLAPAAHEWARTQFATAEALETFAMTLPPMAQLGPKEPAGGEVPGTLSAEQKSVCVALGITEEQYLEQLKLDAATPRRV